MESLAPHTIVVVSHTHWDREWYHPLGRMRQRLARLIDTLLDEPDGLPFLLDGQAIVLDDYLAMRPERADALRAALEQGRVEAGPWYVLADMLLPGGEALVRNLLEGMRTVRELGGIAPDVLYSPDVFGHSAVGPLLADGFGLRVAIVWRGFGGSAHPHSTVARWTHASGATVVLYHLPRDGYEIGSSLPVSSQAAALRWNHMREAVLGRNTLRIALLPNGADHHARQAQRVAAVSALRDVAMPHAVLSDTLRGFAARLAQAAEAVTLPLVSGELRDSSGWTWSLQGTFATRAQQKRTNAIVTRLLVHDAEPWAALAWFVAGNGEASLRMAWKTLLSTHPHDTLCGCSVDDVASAADARWRDARAQAIEIRDHFLHALVRHDAVSQRQLEPCWQATLILRNAAARARGGVATLRLFDRVTPDPVGPGSAMTVRAYSESVEHENPWRGHAELQVIAEGHDFDRVESPLHYPRNAVVRVTDALAWIASLPGYALQPITLDELAVAARRVPDEARIVCRDDGFRNATWELSLAVTDIIASNTSWNSFIHADGQLESTTDVGDTYTPSLRDLPVYGTMSVPILHERGPLRASWRRDHSLDRPRTSATPATMFAREAAPSADTVRVSATVTHSLDAGADWFAIDIVGDNTARDHRLRWLQPLPSGMHTITRVVADAALGAVDRSTIVAGEWPAEQRLPTAPLHRWLWLCGDAYSVGIVSDGLAEYEIVSGHVAITLVRAVGELSRRDLPERPGHAGWPAATPAAQSPGPFCARIAIVMLPLDEAIALERLQQVADDVLLPLTGETWRDVATPLSSFDGLALQGDGLVFSAGKRSEDGQWLVLRCLNQRAAVSAGTWHLPRTATEVRLSRLDETPGPFIPFSDRTIPVEVPPFAVVTLLVR